MLSLMKIKDIHQCEDTDHWCNQVLDLNF